MKRTVTKKRPAILIAAAAIAIGSAAPAWACAHPGAHDITTFCKTKVERTYTLPRDTKPWQYRIIKTHRRVYGCGYAGGQGRKGVYLSKGQRLYVARDPKNSPTASVSAGFKYAGLSYSVSVKIPLGKQTAKSNTTAPTYNKATKSGYYKAYSHVVYDIYTTEQIRRLWLPDKKKYSGWLKGGKGITTKKAYAYKYQLIRQS